MLSLNELMYKRVMGSSAKARKRMRLAAEAEDDEE